MTHFTSGTPFLEYCRSVLDVVYKIRRMASKNRRCDSVSTHYVSQVTYKIAKYSIRIFTKIDQKYGIKSPLEHLAVPTDSFTTAIKDQLLGELEKPNKSWYAMDIDAFLEGESMCLRVTLDVGDRPLHLFVQESGESVEFDAPVLMNFPQRASHMVLSRLCGNNPFMSFRVDEQQIDEGEPQGAQARDVRTNEVLYGYGWFEFDRFLESAFVLLPCFAVQLTEA